MSNLSGQIAVVAGASSGMGRATALALASAGCKVVAGARRPEALQTLANEAAAAGGEILYIKTDASIKADAQALVKMAVERFGRVDVMVNSVGTNTTRRLLADMTDADWQELINVNLISAYNLTMAVLPQLRQQRGGLIIHISSCSAAWPDFSGIGYQAAKRGVNGLAHATRMEEAKNGIRVSVVMPGLTDTPLMEKRKVRPTRETLDKALQPDDIAAACVFLASLPPRAFVPEMPVFSSALQSIGATIA